MHVTQRYDFKDKAADYVSLAGELASLLAGETDLIANAANTSALLFDAIPDISWAGFYFLRGDELVVGPFQGKPACVRICMGKGVCGAAAQQRRPSSYRMLTPSPDTLPATPRHALRS